MNIRHFVVTVVSLLMGLCCFGQGVSSSNDESKQVAVFVYCDKSVTTPVNALRGKLTSVLVNETSDAFIVLDRTDEILSALKSEYNYQGSGLVRDDDLVSIGEHLGAYYLCVVSVTYYSDFNQYTFECKLVNIETRRIEKQSMYPDDEDTMVSSLSPQMQYKVGGVLSKMFKMGAVKGHEWVDLGTGVKWATTNLGAKNPEDYGDYYAWGDANKDKSSYDWSTYRWCNGSEDSLTKYNIDNSKGIVDNKAQLEICDDVANQKWGGQWRTPTDSEWKALINLCDWTWTSVNGVYGYKVVGHNGNSIFLPASDCYTFGHSPVNAGYNGYYWSSSLYLDNPRAAWIVGFSFDYVGRNYGYFRCNGFSIRPVTE